jgi:hypothetical protein
VVERRLGGGSTDDGWLLGEAVVAVTEEVDLWRDGVSG